MSAIIPKLVLISGYLGAGKTSFINWLLEKHPDQKISVILNEFGDIKLESQFISAPADNVVELANGCMCCVAKSDIPRVIEYILLHSPQTEYILVEASGLSDPDPVLGSFNELSEQGKIKLESVICLIDVLNFEKSRLEHRVVTSQVADADLLVLSKESLAEKPQIEQIKSNLKAMLPQARILSWDQNLAADFFLDTHSPASDQSPAPQTSEDHTHQQLQTSWYYSQRPHNLLAAADILRHLPVEIIRGKGILATQDQNGLLQKNLVQYVGSRLELLPSQWTEGETQQTSLLFIGKPFDEKELAKKLDGSQIDKI